MNSFVKKQIDALDSQDAGRVESALRNVWLLNEHLQSRGDDRLKETFLSEVTIETSISQEDVGQMIKAIARFLMNTDTVEFQVSALSILPTYFQPERILDIARFLRCRWQGDPEVSRAAAISLDGLLRAMGDELGIPALRRVCHDAELQHLLDTVVESSRANERSKEAWQRVQHRLTRIKE